MERPLAAAQVNENILYQPDESPPPLASLGHGFQMIMGMLAAMAATTSIIARAGGQPDSYLSWIFFTALAVCGLGAILQTVRVWRFGSGYALSVITATPFIAVCITALLAGGPAMLSSLIAVSALVQFALISRLSLLRRIITPAVAGTVLMLVAATVISVVLGRLPDTPEGTPQAAAPIIASVTLLSYWESGCLPRVSGSSGGQSWESCRLCSGGPLRGVRPSESDRCAWIGIPPIVWAGFDFSLGTAFWRLLPGFVIVNLAVSINSISDTVAIQQAAWRRPRATDFRVVQGAHNLAMLTNLLAALLGTLPNMIGASNSVPCLPDRGRRAPRRSVRGAILIMVAFSPNIALVVAIPRPGPGGIHGGLDGHALRAGHEHRFRDGVDPRKAARGGVSLDGNRLPASANLPGYSQRDVGNAAQQRNDHRLGFHHPAHDADGHDIFAAQMPESGPGPVLPARD